MIKIHQIKDSKERKWIVQFNYCFMIEENNTIKYFSFGKNEFVYTENILYTTSNYKTLVF